MASSNLGGPIVPLGGLSPMQKMLTDKSPAVPSMKKLPYMGGKPSPRIGASGQRMKAGFPSGGSVPSTPALPIPKK